MKTHTHTQGPWRVENWKYTDSRTAWRRDGVPTIVGANDAIAEVFNLYRPNAEDDAESEALANARLIAAAPEMLEALESLAIGLSPASVDMQRENLADICRVCREIAESAISKVKGGNA
jgi:hypothetical protein